MKRALVVGINDYGDPNSNLYGCVNDATKIGELIRYHENGDNNFETKLLTSNEEIIDNACLRKHLESLFKNKADMAFFYFSGHGATSSTGSVICPTDAKNYNLGVSMQDILGLVNNSPINEIIVILDCCHSGAMGVIPALGTSNHVTLREGVSILSASRDSESSIEINGQGIFTSLVCDALEGAAADMLGTITPASVYYHVEKNFGAWDQRPLFKSYIARSTSLRQVAARVSKSDLRKIVQLFPDIDYKLYMDRTYEETESDANTANVAKFKTLKRLQIGGLITIDHHKQDLYWLAMENRYCSLSPIGRYYFNLVKNDKI